MIAPARAVAAVVAACALSGCAVPYYWQAVGGQIEILRRREPIVGLVEDESLDPKLRDTLRRVTAIRRFAVDELGLPDNGSYLSYVALDRSYVVWNVVAADEFSVDPRRWCFPFAGCVAYRGYFDREAAERFEAGLVAEGLDTHSGGTTAYSTLGYFDDPVLSTMINGGEQYIASLLFHELAHQRLYIKDDSELSEAFATVIEEHGTERWLTAHGSAAHLAAYRVRRARYAQFGELIAAQQARLRSLYASGGPAEELRAAKQRAFEQLRADYAALKERWNGAADYDAWFAQPLNNATLASVATYTQWVPALRARLEQAGLTQFYEEAAALAGLSAEERAARLLSWEGAPVVRPPVSASE